MSNPRQSRPARAHLRRVSQRPDTRAIRPPAHRASVARATTASIVRRQSGRTRQGQPNIPNLPRSALLTAVETALRRRATVRSQPLAQRAAPRSAAPAARATTPLRLHRVVSDTVRGATASRSAATARQRLAPATQRSGRARAGLRTHALVRFLRARKLERLSVRAGSRRSLTLALLLVLLLALIPTPVLAYNNTMALARSGIAQLKSAEANLKTLSANPTNLATILSVESNLQQAHDDFAELGTRMTLLSPVSQIPGIDPRLAGALKLVPLVIEGTAAGVLACDALKTLVVGLKDPLGTTGGLSGADLGQITSDVGQIQALYSQIAPQLQSLTPSDLALDPGLWPMVSGLQARLPQVTQLVSDMNGLAQVLPQLLGVGKPSTYLVLVLDSSELRPTGGFIGNFGALTIDSGRIDTGFHISDITLIDSSVKFSGVPYAQFIPIPARYNWLRSVFAYPNEASWSLRDSNLDPNYPTAAQYALQLYQKLLPDAQKNLAAQGSALKLYDPAKSGPFAGVITLSLGFFAQALTITGPITTPQFLQTVTAQNFVSLIHSYALGANATGPDNKACGVTSCSKVFTSDVVKAFIAKVKSNLSLYIGRLGRLFYDSLRTKDIELYLTALQAQQTLRDLKLSAEVAAPTTGDSVFEVEANVGANKDNYFLRYQMADTIALDAAGAATHHLTWSYQWPDNPATLSETFAAGSPDYSAYARVFTPPDARLIAQNNLTGFGADLEFSRNAYHGSVTVGYGQTASYALAWRVPGVVTHDSAGYHYHLIFQRQSGILWPLKLTVTLPVCATLIGAPVTSGLTAQDKVTVAGNTVTITGPLAMDAQAQLNYRDDCLTPGGVAMRASPAFITARSLRVLHWRTVAQRLTQFAATHSAAAPAQPRHFGAVERARQRAGHGLAAQRMAVV